MNDILLAAADLAVEPELVRIAPDHGARVVRRCVDAVALLAATVQAPDATVVVSADLPRLTADAVHRMAATRRVIGLAIDDEGADRLRAIGVEVIVRIGPTADATMGALADALVSVAPAVAGVWGTGVFTVPDEAASVEPDRKRGRVVAGWGPIGSPGRTTVACGMAEALAASGVDVCLVDADTYAPGIAMALGVVEDASGLVVACRHAEAGSLTTSVLSATTRAVRGSWRVLGGLAAPARWSDLRPLGLERVWATCREAFDVTVIDVGFCLEDDDADGAWARRRNAAALTALAAADHVVVVADGTGLVAARLAQGWPQVEAATGGMARTLVRNRADGGGRDWRRALAAAGVGDQVVEVPRDEPALQRCWSQGRSLGEAAPRSRLRPALAEVAARSVAG